jgi:transcriptional regulator with XRE-family HTH domain
MPRKAPLPKIEAQIGARIKEFREEKLISQTAFATKLQISRAQLINYEEGLSPTPWTVGFALNSAFDVNPRWLATGKLPQTLKIKLPEVPAKLYRRGTLSQVYEQCWKQQIETGTLHAVTFGFDPTRKPDALETDILELATTGWLQRVPKDRFREFFLDLSAEAERLILKINPKDQGPIPLK